MRIPFTLLMLVCFVTCCLVSLAASAQDRPVRVWEDASGRFQVRASLIEQTGSDVRLRTADGREITVPVERLGQADQQYLKSLNAPDDNPFAGGQPGHTSDDPAPSMLPSPSVGPVAALPGTGNTLDMAGSVVRNFRPDALRQKFGIPNAMVAVSSVDPYDRVSSPVLTSNDGTMVLVSIARNVAGRPEETRGRIFAVNLAENRAQNVWDKPAGVRVWDHDVASGQTLLVDQLDQFHRGGELVMVEGLATGASRELYRRSLPGAGQPGFAPQVQWAKLLSRGHALALVNDTLYLWDLPAARLVYRIERVGGTSPPALSPGGRYLAVPAAGGATIMETATGQLCGSVTMGGALTPGLTFHPDGKQLVLCAGNRYLVWDCAAGTVVHEATTTDQLGSHPLHWVGPKMFRTQLGSLIHIDLGMSVWKYTTPSASEPLVLGDKLLVATSSGECSVVAVGLPHGSSEAALKGLASAGDAAMLVRPGSEVAVSIETTVEGVDRNQIQKSLGEAISRAGWKVSSRAPITLVAKIGRGKPQQLHYRSMGQPLGSGGSTATLNPFTAELEIRRGGDVLWQRASSNHVPGLLRLEEGETVQDAVRRYEKPNPEFFAMLNLPPRIPKPEMAQQVGMSTLEKGAWRDIDPKILQSIRSRAR
jgi:hypothetical protein